jgi:uncharacterized protein
MIHKFSAKNYYSFEDNVEVDFRVDEKAPKNGAYANIGNSRVSLVEAIIGPNASGKTTALKALAFIQWLLVQSFRHDRSDLPFMPFAGNADLKQPTELSVEFEMEQGLHIYTVVIDQSKIISESLLIRTLTKQRTTTKKLFSRTWDNDAKAYTLEDPAFGIPEKYFLSKDLRNTSVLTAASRLGHDYARQVIGYWKRFETNVEVDERFVPYAFGAYRALHYFESHESSKKMAEKDVRRYADLGIDSFGKHGVIKHKFGDKTFELELENESSGTHQYIALRRMMDEALEKGGLVVVDEFDAFLHPQMFASLVSKFLDPKHNKGQAQLLLTAQDLLILNALDKYQVNLAKKSDRGVTTLRRLDSVRKGVRADENYLAKYMKGVYGSWPVELNLE